MSNTVVNPKWHSLYTKPGPNGEFFDWGQFACDMFGYNIYKCDDHTKSDIVKEAAHRHNLPVLNVKASQFDPQDYTGIPDFEVSGFRPGLHAREISELEFDLGVGNADIVLDVSYAAKDKFLDELNNLVQEYRDVFFPPMKLKQSNLDIVEAQGGFDEEDN